MRSRWIVIAAVAGAAAGGAVWGVRHGRATVTPESSDTQLADRVPITVPDRPFRLPVVGPYPYGLTPLPTAWTPTTSPPPTPPPTTSPPAPATG
jgi:hypothetical protein